MVFFTEIEKNNPKDRQGIRGNFPVEITFKLRPERFIDVPG